MWGLFQCAVPVQMRVAQGGQCSHCTHMASSCTCGRALRGGEDGEWVRDLTSDGDVESNPGPPKVAPPVEQCKDERVASGVVGSSASCGEDMLVRALFGLACPVEGESSEALQVMSDAGRGRPLRGT